MLKNLQHCDFINFHFIHTCRKPVEDYGMEDSSSDFFKR